MEEPLLKALKEEYIGYGGKKSFEMIEHLCSKISKITNKDKVQLKKKVFIEWAHLQVLLAYFKQIDKARKQLAMQRVKISEEHLVIHVVDQMYDLDWFLGETMN